MIRKSFYPICVLPLALRVVGTNSTITNLNISASLQHVSFNQSHSFSVAAAEGNDLVESSLRKLLKHEIKSLKFNLKNSKVNIPDSSAFKQVDENNCRILNLRNKFAGEWINIIIRMQEVSLNKIGTNYDDKDKQEIRAAAAIPMIVSIEQPGLDEILVFDLTISVDDIVIHRHYFGDRMEKEYYYHEGPKFSELSNELQESLYKYLEARGINSNLLYSLPKKIVEDTYRKDILSLKELREYIKN